MKELIAYVAMLSGLDFIVGACQIIENLDVAVEVTHKGSRSHVVFHKEFQFWQFDSPANWATEWGFFGRRGGTVPTHYKQMLDDEQLRLLETQI